MIIWPKKKKKMATFFFHRTKQLCKMSSKSEFVMSGWIKILDDLTRNESECPLSVLNWNKTNLVILWFSVAIIFLMYMYIVLTTFPREFFRMHTSNRMADAKP